MDVAYPIRAIVPKLEGPILEVLARTTQPLTGREIHHLARTGSPNGVRLVLSRLAEQGIVHAEERAKALFYVANREHLAWPAVELLRGIRSELIRRLIDEIGSWSVLHVHTSLFGSAAREDGDASSDIDILLVRPNRLSEDETPWANQVDALRQRVHTWTGNRCQALQLDLQRLAEHVQAQDPLVEEWLRDSIKLAGSELRLLVYPHGTVDKESPMHRRDCRFP